MPILIKHLQLSYSDTTRKEIARSLAVPEARSTWPIPVIQYQKAPMEGVDQDGVSFGGAKEGLACALLATVIDETFKNLWQLSNIVLKATSISYF